MRALVFDGDCDLVVVTLAIQRTADKISSGGFHAVVDGGVNAQGIVHDHLLFGLWVASPH
jgi:hypothetical protein